jgi:D-3-phosphoglycerate dehydrogenase
MDGETRKALQPILYLAERLGLFQAMYTQGRPHSIQINYHGDVGVTDTYPITAAIVTGFLKPLVETVNMVSAPSQLKERGIESSERRSPAPSNYAFEIGLTVETDIETHTVTGTLFHKTDARICSIDGMRVDAKPEGYMLVCRNEDKPLIIGRMCTKIGEAGVNIANLMLGRDERGGHALTVLNLDQPLSPEVMESCRQVPHVIEVRLVNLTERSL